MLAALYEAVGFQFVQDFAQGRRTDIEQFRQLFLADAVPCPQQGNNSPLATVVRAAFAVSFMMAAMFTAVPPVQQIHAMVKLVKKFFRRCVGHWISP